MDKFRVGQKVRIIKVNLHPELLGTVATIKEQRRNIMDCFGKRWFGYVLDIKAIDQLGKEVDVCPKEEYLEPVYDGDEKSSWSESVWKPKELVKD